MAAIPADQQRTLLNGWEDTQGPTGEDEYGYGMTLKCGWADGRPKVTAAIGEMSNAYENVAEILIPHGMSKAAALKAIDRMRATWSIIGNPT